MVRQTVSLRLGSITKSFPGVRALHQVDLDCYAGEVHALVGENGSGKSTLVSIASGIIAADSGVVEIFGTRLAAADPALVRRLGLSTVYQDTSLVGELTVAENLYLGVRLEDRPAYRDLPAWAKQQIARYGLRVAPEARIEHLAPGTRQLIDVVKALLWKPKILLLDEPTSALDSTGVAFLEQLIATATAGGTAVLYISHRLGEVLNIADRVTVLRDGETQGTYRAENVAVEHVVALMVGAPLDLEFPPKGTSSGRADSILDAEGLTGAGFGPIELRLHKGEILGLAGAEGNGQREVLRALAGLEEAQGRVQIEGQETRLDSVPYALAKGVMMLSGDRLSESVFPVLSVRENMDAHVLGQFSRLGLVDRSVEQAAVSDLVQKLDIVTPSLGQPVRFLSGGNQQKVVMSRAFLYPAKVILVDEPTQGVDARARLDIYRALRARADDGAGIVVKSSDALELAGLCDRVLVLSRGRVIRELQGAELTESSIVGAFVSSRGGAEAVSNGTHHERLHRGPSWLRGLLASEWVPLAALVLLMLVIGAYTGTRSPAFFGMTSLQNWLILALPLVIVAMAQLNVLLVGGIDISVGSLMSLVVVLSSFIMGQNAPPLVLALGVVACIALGVAVGTLNGSLVRGLRINPVVATIATLGVLQGVALILRPTPGGLISLDFLELMSWNGGLVPWGFPAVVIAAVLAEMWLRRTYGGLATRAVGFRDEVAYRLGIRREQTHVRAYMLAGLAAAVAGLFLAAQVGTGAPTAGSSYILLSIAAPVLGGASLFGGKGSFIGCIVGGLFVALLINVIPFLQIPDALGYLATGALTVVAILIYSRNVKPSWLS